LVSRRLAHGGGPNIAVFDGAPFDDGLLHRMGMVADGKTVNCFWMVNSARR